MSIVVCKGCNENKKMQAKGLCQACYGKFYRSNTPGLDAKNWVNMRKDPRKNILKGAQKRARLRGRPCSIKLEDILVPSICPVLGIAMEPVVGAAANENSPSLDEIVVGKGGNVTLAMCK